MYFDCNLEELKAKLEIIDDLNENGTNKEIYIKSADGTLIDINNIYIDSDGDVVIEGDWD